MLPVSVLLEKKERETQGVWGQIGLGRAGGGRVADGGIHSPSIGRWYCRRVCLQIPPYVMPSPAGSQCYAPYYCPAPVTQPSSGAPPPSTGAMMASVSPSNSNNGTTDLQASDTRAYSTTF